MVQNQYVFKNAPSERSTSYHFSLSAHISKPTPISKPLTLVSSIHFLKNVMHIHNKNTVFTFLCLFLPKMVTDSRCSYKTFLENLTTNVDIFISFHKEYPFKKRAM